jgi:predicted membrane channel-forming protein YqfA (hemolysin III family)
VVTGATVGKYIPNPILAFTAGILIHFLIDKIPHYWPVSDKKLKTILLVFDYTFTIIFITSLIVTDRWSAGVFMAVVGSLIIDIILVGLRTGRESKLGVWHNTRQKHLSKPFNFLTDLIVITIGMLIVFLT